MSGTHRRPHVPNRPIRVQPSPVPPDLVVGTMIEGKTIPAVCGGYCANPHCRAGARRIDRGQMIVADLDGALYHEICAISGHLWPTFVPLRDAAPALAEAARRAS